MLRFLLLLVLYAVPSPAANVRLYLKDGTYHIVREYQVQTDRVRYYSVERSDWEEIPLDLVDLKRTQTEARQRDEALRTETKALEAEEKLEREQREEQARVPGEPGAYYVDGSQLVAIKQAEPKVVNNKRRSVLKVLTPIPVVSGKASVEIDGERSPHVVATPEPEFYIRLATIERFGILRLKPKSGSRIVENWDIIPVTKEIVEQHEEVEVFRKQVGDDLYKIWPAKPLAPGEYAVVEYTEGKGNIQIWDFAYRPAGK